jgi:hypothetical protein
MRQDSTSRGAISVKRVRFEDYFIIVALLELFQRGTNSK